MTLKRPESVLVVMYNEHKQVLVIQRIDDANFWQSVTGTMEACESPVQTAKREVLEETGIELRFPSENQGQGGLLGGDKNRGLYHLRDCRLVNQYSIRPDWRYRYPAGVDKNFEYVFCAQVPANSTITLTEHTAYEWLSKQDAVDKVWSNTNKFAIERFVPQ
jgi:dATP pyrophosphohydrolase